MGLERQLFLFFVCLLGSKFSSTSRKMSVGECRVRSCQDAQNMSVCEKAYIISSVKVFDCTSMCICDSFDLDLIC